MYWVLCRKHNRRELLTAKEPVTRAKQQSWVEMTVVSISGVSYGKERTGETKEKEPTAIGNHGMKVMRMRRLVRVTPSLPTGCRSGLAMS